MEQKRTSVWENSLIWFGAAVSIAEIQTGTYIAPLGLKTGFAAIIIGHIIGCAMLFLAGLIGGLTHKSSMETVKMSFGCRGGLLFAILNIVQLVGWTAIMIYDGALAADGIITGGTPVWCAAIGALIIVWILIGVKNLGKVNIAAVTSLFVLTVILSAIIFREKSAILIEGDMSFGAAVELSAAMPLSWLPLISDYTRDAKKPMRATAASAITYGAVSCWMYAIGLGAAIYAEQADIAQIMLKGGLSVAGLIIIILSTVTTTFLDAYSAGISSESISAKISGKKIAVCAAAIGTVCALLLPLGNITDFLYFIGSVFAPMIAVQIADFFILKNDSAKSAFNVRNLIIWAIGFSVYRLLMKQDLPVGSTLPDMAIVVFICVAVSAVEKKLRAETG